MDIGIDFGTTKTLVAYPDDHGRACLVRLGRGHDEIPTCLHLDTDGAFTFGEDAEDQCALLPAGFLRRIKREMGSPRRTTVQLHDRRQEVTELVARFLNYVRERVTTEALHGKTVTGAILTVPASAGQLYRKQLETAAQQAGFGQVRIIEEPVAAGLAFLSESGGAGAIRRIVVFDWGGGTLDLAGVELQGGEFRVVPGLVDGRSDLGGEDLDDALWAWADARLGGALNQCQDTARLRQVQAQLHEAKHRLGRVNSVSVSVLAGGMQKVAVTRADLDELAGPMVKDAMELLSALLTKARGMNWQPDGILLAGGSSRLPQLTAALPAVCGNLRVLQFHHAVEAVALGAAAAHGTLVPNWLVDYPSLTSEEPEKRDDAGDDEIILKLCELTREELEEMSDGGDQYEVEPPVGGNAGGVAPVNLPAHESKKADQSTANRSGGCIFAVISYLLLGCIGVFFYGETDGASICAWIGILIGFIGWCAIGSKKKP